MELVVKEMAHLPTHSLTYKRFNKIRDTKKSTPLFTFTNVFVLLIGVCASLFYTFKGIKWNYMEASDCGSEFKSYAIALALLNLLIACFSIAFIFFALRITQKYGRIGLVVTISIIRGI